MLSHFSGLYRAYLKYNVRAWTWRYGTLLFWHPTESDWVESAFNGSVLAWYFIGDR